MVMLSGADTIIGIIENVRKKDTGLGLSMVILRIIANPGTENPCLLRLAQQQVIEVIRGCTLVMLSIGEF